MKPIKTRKLIEKIEIFQKKNSLFYLPFAFFNFCHRSDSDFDDSDVECMGSVTTQTIDITNDDDIQEFLESCEATTTGPVKTKGELGMDDLPPIAELTITVPESECVELGSISGIVDTLGKLIET